MDYLNARSSIIYSPSVIPKSEEMLSQNPDCSLLGVTLLVQFRGIATDEARLKHQFGQGTEIFNEDKLLLAIKSLDLKGRIVKQPISRPRIASLPVLVLKENEEYFISA